MLGTQGCIFMTVCRGCLLEKLGLSNNKLHGQHNGQSRSNSAHTNNCFRRVSQTNAPRPLASHPHVASEMTLKRTPALHVYNAACLSFATRRVTARIVASTPKTRNLLGKLESSAGQRMRRTRDRTKRAARIGLILGCHAGPFGCGKRAAVPVCPCFR